MVQDIDKRQENRHTVLWEILIGNRPRQHLGRESPGDKDSRSPEIQIPANLAQFMQQLHA